MNKYTRDDIISMSLVILAGSLLFVFVTVTLVYSLFC